MQTNPLLISAIALPLVIVQRNGLYNESGSEKYWIVALLALILFKSLMNDEGYENIPQSLNIAQRALLDVSAGKVKASKNSIKRVALTQVNVKVADKSIGEAFKSIIDPSERVILRARPKYVLLNAVIVGKSFTVEATGKSTAEAKQNAHGKVNEALKNIETTLKSAGLLG